VKTKLESDNLELKSRVSKMELENTDLKKKVAQVEEILEDMQRILEGLKQKSKEQSS
jgi:hypothetical protein